MWGRRFAAAPHMRQAALNVARRSASSVLDCGLGLWSWTLRRLPTCVGRTDLPPQEEQLLVWTI